MNGMFVSANSATTAGQERKSMLNQPGQARQPDVIGKTEGSFELYYGELKTAHTTQEDINTDRLRIATFTKDTLDHMESTLVHTPPILSFQAIGGSITFYIGGKIENVIIHSKLSTIVLPTKLKDLDLKEEVFYTLFQVQSLVRLASERTRLRRPISRTFQVFPTWHTTKAVSHAEENRLFGPSSSLIKTSFICESAPSATTLFSTPCDTRCCNIAHSHPFLL
jgi:hypothetical protein